MLDPSPEVEWDLELGDGDTRTSIQARHRGSLSRGISAPGADTGRHNIMLWWHPLAGSRHGYVDGWTADGTAFYFTGTGQAGDQHFDPPLTENGRVRDHVQNGDEIRLLRYSGKNEVTYVARLRLDREAPWAIIDGIDRFGQRRRMIQFKFLPLGETLRLESDPVRSTATVVPTAGTRDLPVLTGRPDVPINAWWAGNGLERYWMEVTGRPDVGANLWAPQEDERGSLNNPGYVLVTWVQDGDIVFHYSRDLEAIVAWSYATGGYWEDEFAWASVTGGAEPYKRPVWVKGLEGPYAIDPPVTRLEIQDVGEAVGAVREGVISFANGSVYFPFIPYGTAAWRNLRGGQPYMAKFPDALVDVIPRLRDAVGDVPAPADPPTVISTSFSGLPYIDEDEEVPPSERNPFEVDPAVVERGILGHKRTQNQLAAILRELKVDPKRPAAGQPLYDLAWEVDGKLFVAEIKSLTKDNEERQLRLGLGQVLRYRQLLAAPWRPAVAVLAVEREPSDKEWITLCDALGVRLVWPDFSDMDLVS